MDWTVTEIRRFWGKTERSGDCFVWTGSRSNPDGHVRGSYGVLKFQGKRWKAHRLSYAFYVGDIPKNLWVLHKCDNPPCVRPSHLFLGDALANSRDCVAKGRLNDRSAEHSSAAKFCWADIITIRALYKYTDLTLSDIARKYNVSQPAIRFIVLNKTWVSKHYKPVHRNKRFKLCVDDVIDIRRAVKPNPGSIRAAATKYGVRVGHIRNILSGAVWKLDS